MKANYGIDAPNVLRNLFLFGMLLVLIGILFPQIHLTKNITIENGTFFFWSFFLFATGFLMILYSKFGKYKHRDRMLNLIDWKGNELVLDVGTGSGLLMIGAAKKLTTGKAFGIDIWNRKDLSSNTYNRTMQNAKIENVTGKIEIKNESIIKTSFEDNYFDVILSNLCLHNIYKKDERIKACKEIVRILKPGGKAVISDMKNIKEYQSVFNSEGLKTKKSKLYILNIFPPLRIITAEKNKKF